MLGYAYSLEQPLTVGEGRLRNATSIFARHIVDENNPAVEILTQQQVTIAEAERNGRESITRHRC